MSDSQDEVLTDAEKEKAAMTAFTGRSPDEFVTKTREILFPHLTIRIEEDDDPPDIWVDPPGLLERRCFLKWGDEFVRIRNVYEIGARVGVSIVGQDLLSDLEKSGELLAALSGIDMYVVGADDREFLAKTFHFESSKLVTHGFNGVLTSYALDGGNDDLRLFEINVFLDRLSSESYLVAGIYRASSLLVPVREALCPDKVTEAEYLDQSRASRDRFEFDYGRVTTRLNTSRDHDQIALNLWEILDNKLKQRGGTTHAGDLRVCIERQRCFAYPDLVATSGEPEFLDLEPRTLINPSLLVEISSPISYSGYTDRGQRADQYRLCPSLREYLVVNEWEAIVEQFLRRDDGRWDLVTTTGLDATLRMPSVDCEIPLTVLYNGVANVQRLASGR